MGMSEQVDVDIWSHPDWEMDLMLEANDQSRATALDILGEGNGDPSLLTSVRSAMSRKELEDLPEWDG